MRPRDYASGAVRRVLVGPEDGVRDVELPHSQYAIPVYYLVATAEALCQERQADTRPSADDSPTEREEVRQLELELDKLLRILPARW